MNMIDVQDAYIARLAYAHAKIGKRSAGIAFNRSRRAARKDATITLLRRGYTAAEAAQIIKDAYDMFVLERDAL